jgi:hypothetical protein
LTAAGDSARRSCTVFRPWTSYDGLRSSGSATSVVKVDSVGSLGVLDDGRLLTGLLTSLEDTRRHSFRLL